MSPVLTTAVVLSLGGMMVVAAIAVLFIRDLFSAIIVAGFISLSASVMFLLMDAADVAITEASIGAVLATMIFLWGRGKIGGER